MKINLSSNLYNNQAWCWSKILRITNSFIGKAIIICSVVSYVLKILDALLITKLIDASGLLITLNGALIFLFGSALAMIFSPNRIHKFIAQETYIQWCLRELQSITLSNEFQTLLNLPSNYSYSSSTIIKKVRDLGDLETITDRGIKLPTAVRTLAEAQYFVDDMSNPIMRLLTIIFLASGTTMMFFLPVLRVIKEAWRL